MLIPSITILKEYVPVHRNFQYATIQPFLRQADSELKKLISEAQYDLLVADIATTGALQAGVMIAQHYVANKAMALGIWHIRNHISELGAQLSYSDSAQTSKPTTQEDVKRLEKGYLRQAYDAAEALFELFEELPAVYTAFFTSDQFSQYTQLFARNLTIAERHFPALQSRQLWHKLRGEFIKAHKFYIQHIISAALLADLEAYHTKTIKEEDISSYPAQYAELLELCTEVETVRGVMSGLPYVDMVLLFQAFYMDEFSAGVTQATKPLYDRMQHMREDLRQRAAEAEERLKAFLKDNVAELPLYAASEQWAIINPELEENDVTRNQDRTDFWL